MVWSKFVFAAVLLGGMHMTADAGQAAGGPIQGQWAGDRLRLSITAQGARIEMDCATGTINGPLQPAADGKWAASGTFEQHQGGPQRADVVPAAARFSGEIKSGVMQLTILPQGASQTQIYTLREGASVKLVRCL